MTAVGTGELLTAGASWSLARSDGERGDEHRASALRLMDEEGVREPARFAFTMLPGFGERGAGGEQ